MTEPIRPDALSSLPLDILACPRCDRALEQIGAALHCPACAIDFPCFAGVPWLFSEPNAARAEWRDRYEVASQQARRDAKDARAEATAGVRETTRARLTRFADAKNAYADELQALLAPLGARPSETPLESHLALKTRLPPSQGIDTYHANLHRDWCWGDAENEASVTMVRSALDAPGGRILVLGAGAGRLAYDLHRSAPGTQTVALDLNPLLVFVAAAVSSGREVVLHEFPLAPASASDVAHRRLLRAPEPATPGLFWMLGDALRPPFQRDAFDAVVTPWFVDIIDQDLAVTAQRINRLLAPGGRWVVFGSLSFGGPEHARRYSPEEAREVIGEAGFELPALAEETLPYLCSPASRHGRRERVVTLSARKLAAVDVPPRHEALPDWLTRSNRPVPLIPAFRTQALTTRIYAFIMSMIDGKRTITDMAALMEAQRLMPKADAEAAVRGFLIKMYDESRSGTRY